MPKKVYELANEVGIGALELVEKLKVAGIIVRNHMASLTDEELDKAKAILFPPEPQAATTVVKKKVVRKKVATDAPASDEAIKPVPKTVTDVVAEAAAPSESSTEPTTAAKRKVVTIKRKSKTEDAHVAEVDEESVHVVATQDSDELDEVETVEPREGGLQIVQEAPKKEEVKVVKKVERREEEVGVYREKLHTFTPIFVPEKEAEEAGKQPAARVDETGTPAEIAARAKVSSKILDLEEEEGKDKKKRLGDLAAVVSSKGAAKSKDITTLRADEELKFASSVIGKTIFTPAVKKKIYVGPTQQTQITEVKESKRVIDIDGGCTVADLAQKLSIKFEALANKVLELNLLVKRDDFLGLGLCNDIAALYHYRVENKAFDEAKIIEKAQEKPPSDLPLRNPIITIMGHVDHGKTSLLDYIRKAKVAEGEAGGITQHIGAYSVQVKGHTLTFLDTPGHAAFASMRQRGADVTDIVVLVVAADDGVMPQTKESIRFCQNANKPIIVAVNKMDKPGANPDRVKQEMMEFSLTPEEWGGETQYVPISALTGDGVDALLESIQVQAEMMDLRESPMGTAVGVIIESKVEQGRGPVSTILVQKGTLKKGDAIVAGETYGRARSLMDYSGKMVDSAGPSTPVQVLGFEGVASPGDIMNVVTNEREGKRIADNRINERKALELAPVQKKASLEDFFATAQSEGEKKILKLLIRTDVHGSFEAIKKAIENLGNNEVGVQVLGGGVGAITDNDVMMASSSTGYIIGFNMRPVTSARKLAEEKGVDIKNYSIIYELINDIQLALEGMLEPETVETYIGRAEVRDTFTVPKAGTIAGCAIVDGKMERGCNIRLLRDGKIMYDGKLSTLKRFKDEVKEVKQGYECGMALENYNDIKVGDLIEGYIMEQKKRKLELQNDAVL